MITVLYFGVYNPKHTRNSNLINGLLANDVNVIQSNCRGKNIFSSYIDLIFRHKRLKDKYQIMIVGFPGHLIMPLAWAICKIYKKKLIFDAFVSLYDSLILDQKKHGGKSISAAKYWIIDWLSVRLADIVLMETEEYVKYFVETFGADKKKFKRIFVGVNDKIIYPRRVVKSKNNFLVHFHGTYLPIQGVPYIIKAAKLLEDEDIYFNIVGKLNTYTDAIKMANNLRIRNIKFIDYVPYEKLADLMAQADICLGKFGSTEKAERCCAFKIMEALAMEKPVITADTPAIREILTNRENVIFCRIADEKDLAEKILYLKNNPELRHRVAKNGYFLFKNKLTEPSLGAELKKIIAEIL